MFGLFLLKADTQANHGIFSDSAQTYVNKLPIFKKDFTLQILTACALMG
jgi:hypothetical protein